MSTHAYHKLDQNKNHYYNKCGITKLKQNWKKTSLSKCSMNGVSNGLNGHFNGQNGHKVTALTLTLTLTLNLSYIIL